MKRASGWAAWLDVDERGARALAETLADWRVERASARTAIGRFVSDARNAVAIARVVAALSIREFATFSAASRLLLFVTLPAALVTAVGSAHAVMMHGPAGTPAQNLLTGLPLLLPSTIAGLLPISLLVETTWPGRRRRALLPLWAVISLCLEVAIVGWGAPAANQTYRIWFAGGFWPAPPTPSIHEMNILALVSLLSAPGPLVAPATRHLWLIATLALFAPVATLAGAAVSRLGAALKLAVIPVATLGYFAMINCVNQVPPTGPVVSLTLMAATVILIVRRSAPAPAPQSDPPGSTPQ